MFQLCLQLFQLFRELREQAWAHLQHLVLKDTAATAGVDNPTDPMASIVSGLLGVLSRKVSVVGKLLVMLMAVVVVVFLLIPIVVLLQIAFNYYRLLLNL